MMDLLQLVWKGRMNVDKDKINYRLVNLLLVIGVAEIIAFMYKKESELN